MAINEDSRERQAKAASELEDLVVMMTEVKRLLREGQEDGLAHALVYQLRWRLGRTCRDLDRGFGVPKSQYKLPAEQILDVRTRMMIFANELEVKQHLQESASKEYRERVERWLESNQSTAMVDNGPDLFDIWYREPNGTFSVTD